MLTSEKRFREYFGLMNRWMYLRNSGIRFSDHSYIKQEYKYAVYGLGNIGKRLIEQMRQEDLNIVYYIDKHADIMFADISIYSNKEKLPEADVMIVSQICDYEEIYNDERTMFSGKIISLQQIVDDLWKKAWERNDRFY